MQGKLEEAQIEYRRALTVWEASLGPEHPHVAVCRNNLAGVILSQGKHEEAEAEYRRVLALWEAALGPEHPHVAAAVHNIAAALQGQGRLQEAEAEYRRALALREAAVGPEHPDALLSRSSLAELLLERGRLEQAHALAEQVWERHQQDDTFVSDRVRTAFLLARTCWARGDHARAHDLAQRAIADLAEADNGDDEQAATVREWLAAHPRPSSDRGD